MVCASLLRSPGKPDSLRNVSLDIDVPKSTVQRIVKGIKSNFLKIIRFIILLYCLTTNEGKQEMVCA